MNFTARTYLSVVTWLTFISFTFTSIAYEVAWEKEKQFVSTYNQNRQLFSEKGPSALAHTLASIPGVEFPDEVETTLIKYLSTDIGSYLPEMSIEVQDENTFSLVWDDQVARFHVEDFAKGQIRINEKLVTLKRHKSFEYNLVRVLNALGFETKEKTDVSWFFSAMHTLGLFLSQLDLIPAAQAACPAGTTEHHPGHCVASGGGSGGNSNSGSSSASTDHSNHASASSSSGGGSTRGKSSSSDGKKKGGKGIIVVAVIALLLLLLFFWNKKKKKKAEAEAAGHVESRDASDTAFPVEDRE